jgi:hypothetical protein
VIILFRKDAKKYLIIRKTLEEPVVFNEALLKLNDTSLGIILTLLLNSPVTTNEKNDLVPRIQTTQSNKHTSRLHILFKISTFLQF